MPMGVDPDYYSGSRYRVPGPAPRKVPTISPETVILKQGRRRCGLTPRRPRGSMRRR